MYTPVPTNERRLLRGGGRGILNSLRTFSLNRMQVSSEITPTFSGTYSRYKATFPRREPFLLRLS